MSILVTGALGHIGSHLCEALSKLDYSVIGIDLMRIDPTKMKVPYERGDISSFVEMHKIFKKYNVKHVYHLAGEVGRELGEEFPRRGIDMNVSGTMNIIQLCIEHGAKLYNASTSEVYGKLADKFKITEDLTDKYPPDLTNCYAISKYQAEQYIKHFVDHYGLEALSFRFFMCYGDGEFPSPFRSAMTRFIYSVLNNQSINVHRNTYRSWCYVDDIVEGCILALDSCQGHEYNAYNIGRDELISTQKIAEMICDYTNKARSLIRLTDPDWLVTRKKDTSFEKAYKKFGYKSKISTSEGIKKTINWQEKHLLGL